MKKIISMILVTAMILSSLIALTACGGGNSEELKFGFGLTTSTATENATSVKPGSSELAITAAAVLVDADGKVVKAYIDALEAVVEHTANGNATAPGEFLTKQEKGDAYGMVASGATTREWYTQVNAFCSVAVGKTKAEVQALMASNYKGTEEVINAGCTIYVSDLVGALCEAMDNAKASNAAANDTLKLGIVTKCEETNATATVAGKNALSVNIFAAAVNGEGKVSAATIDCVEVDFTFNASGESTYNNTKVLNSKRELGFDYGMVAYSNGLVTKEWFEQADIFAAQCIGKNATEIVALAVNGYGTDAVKAAGCTMAVAGFVQAAAKIN